MRNALRDLVDRPVLGALSDGHRAILLSLLSSQLQCLE